MALKELEVRYAAKRATDYKLADGEGLHLLVRSHGSKLWWLKYRFAGKETLLSFGAYPDSGADVHDADLGADQRNALGDVGRVRGAARP